MILCFEFLDGEVRILPITHWVELCLVLHFITGHCCSNHISTFSLELILFFPRLYNDILQTPFTYFPPTTVDGSKWHPKSMSLYRADWLFELSVGEPALSESAIQSFFIWVSLIFFFVSATFALNQGIVCEACTCSNRYMFRIPFLLGYSHMCLMCCGFINVILQFISTLQGLFFEGIL